MSEYQTKVSEKDAENDQILFLHAMLFYFLVCELKISKDDEKKHASI